ncbi:MAG: DNA translocase FtsK 4TM domain-containing protein [Myxococcota bacterium]|nr:DNA translocase FtsK 4TM domain-containing protein [Myxococcota bacterium]
MPSPRQVYREAAVMARRSVPFMLLSGVLLSVYTALSLATHSPEDPSFSHSSVGEISNLGGPVGASLSEALYLVLGYGAWIVAPVGALLALKLAGRSVGGLKRLLGWSGLLWVSLCLVALLAPMGEPDPFAAGGLIGELSVKAMGNLVGPAGTWIIVLGCALGIVPFVAGVELESMMDRGLVELERAGPQVRQLGSGIGSRARSGASSFGSRIVDLFHPLWDWQWRQDDELEDDEPDSIPPSAPFESAPFDVTSHTHAVPYAEPELELERSVDVTPAAHEPLFAEPDPAMVPPDPMERTQIGQRELVEVEWETTNHSAARMSAARMSVGPAPGARIHPPPLDELPSEPLFSPLIFNEKPRLPRDLAPVAQQPNPQAAVSESPAIRTPPLVAPTIVSEPMAQPPIAPASVKPPPIVQPTVDRSAVDRSAVDRSAVDRSAVDLPAVDRSAVDLPAVDFSSVVQAPTEQPIVPEQVAEPEVQPVLSAPPAPAVAIPDATDLPQTPPPAAVANPQPVEKRGPRLEVDSEGLVSGGSDDGMALIERNPYDNFELPHLGLLDSHARDIAQFNELELQQLASTLEQKLADFRVEGEVTAIRPGPVITTFEYLPAPGIKISRISGLSDDIAMALKALRVRIVAPIPGKGVVGIEIPNKHRQMIWVRDILSSEIFRKNKTKLPLALGKSVEGKPRIADLAKMPHLLVGGTTGSGKSVGVNAMLLSMLFTRTPAELRLILIDPKMLEFELYNEIPHLLHPVVTDPKLASAALKWACAEMDQRYRMLANWKTRNIESFNRKVEQEADSWTPAKARRYFGADLTDDELPPPPKKMPYIVIVIDELADLMMIAAKDVEESIIRIAQKARAAGIHLIVATQRPSVNVITGLIKANMPSRVAFQIRTKVDSRTILDQNGAENLLGKGDMLFLPPGVAALERCHGAFVSDEEVRTVTDFLRDQASPIYEAELKADEGTDAHIEEEEYDDFYDQAVAYVCQKGKASTSMIQRQFKIGYNRAARMIEVMEREGVVGPADGARPRKVLVDAH